MSTPLYAGLAESGGYDVHPAAAEPPSTVKLASMMMAAGTEVQNDSMFRNGNAMSRAPIMSGMRKLPKHPTRIGMTAKKIMIVACMVKNALYVLGGMMPSYMSGSGTQCMPGTAVSGHASSQRTSIASRPPTTSIPSPMPRNCFPIIL